MLDLKSIIKPQKIFFFFLILEDVDAKNVWNPQEDNLDQPVLTQC